MSVRENNACGELEGSFPIHDAHVHCYPAEVISDPVAWARRHREPHWGTLVSDGPQGWADPESLVRQMDADGIETVLLQAWYWENPDTARLQNEWHAEWIARYPDRLLACAAVHPDLPDPVAVLEEAAGWGACAVGECLPQIQTRAGWEHPAWEEILSVTSRTGWPVCLHVTEPVGHRYPGRVETSLMELIARFEQFPEQRWLCAHWGGGLPFHALNRRVGRALRNVWFDTAASPLLYDRRVWRTVCDLVGAEKVLFGSDFPLRLYPRVETHPVWSGLLTEFHQSGLPFAERRIIAGENLRALLGMGVSDPDA
jgi:predicted TIM-barrel fold metal-dependent hydrolase